MITIRTEDNLMISTLDGNDEKAMRQAIIDEQIQTRSLTLKADSKHTKGYVLTEDYVFTNAGTKLFLWKGTQILIK